MTRVTPRAIGMRGRASSHSLRGPSPQSGSQLPAALVGGERVGDVVFHGVTERDAAAEQINTEILTILRATAKALGADPSLIVSREKYGGATSSKEWRDRVLASLDAMKASPLAAKLRPFFDAASSIKQEWDEFYESNVLWSTYFGELTTGWEEYKRWFDRAVALRAQAEKLGVKIDSPPPTPLTQSQFDALLDALKKAAEGAGGFLKIAGYVALGLGGVFVLAKIAEGHGS